MTSKSVNPGLHKTVFPPFQPRFTSHPSSTASPTLQNTSTLEPTPTHINTTIVMSTEQTPTGAAADNDYQSRTGQSEIPVQRDEAPVESTEYDNGGDSDKQLGKWLYSLSFFNANQSQSATRRTQSTAATSSTSVLVELPRSLVPTPSLAMRKALMQSPQTARTAPLLHGRCLLTEP
jgi:hypothetical protein